jgi:hypothetical protein
MPCSLAQLEANRRNASKSPGPKTIEGKLKSRSNAYKHGQTGDGSVLTGEDAADVDRRLETLVAEMRPRNELARECLWRVALMMFRLRRSALHEMKATSSRMRYATARHDDARKAEAENYYSWIAAEPATNARRLRGSPEGIDILMGAFEGLRSDLVRVDGMLWTWQHADQLHHLMGRRMLDVPVTRARALGEAILSGDFKHLDESDGAGLDKNDRKLWARDALVKLIDAEIEALNVLREGLDLEGLEQDRAEATERAMFDASPEAILARKYEAANERSLYRALREFREAQGMTPEVEVDQMVVPSPSEKSGSFFPEPSGADPGTADVDPTDDDVPAGVVVPGVEAVWAGQEGGSKATRPRLDGRKSRRRSR